MTSQLERISLELAEARRRARDVAGPLSAERWRTRPAAEEWSVAECLSHLNLTSRAMLPLIRDAITRGRDQRLLGSGPYRRDLIGWFVGFMAEPALRIRVKTTAPFVPPEIEPRDRVLAEFDRLQEDLGNCVKAAEGLDLGRLRIVSPFDARLKYNLYSAFRIVPAHQRQHLAQAEAVIRAIK